MHAVVIDGLEGDPAAMARTAAEVLGGTAYDYRASMIPPGPAVLRVFGDPGEAGAVRAALLRAGFDASVVPVTKSLSVFETRRFVLGADALEVEDRAGQQQHVPYGDVDFLLRASAVSTMSKTKTVRERKFSPVRSVLSGGLVNTKVQQTQKTERSTESDELLYIWARADEPILMREKGLLYQGLGDEIAASRTANFRFVVEQLRRSCPAAGFDERLRQRAAQSQTLGRTLSAETYLHFAVALVAHSIRPGRPFAAFR